MRKTALNCVLEMARADERVCFVGSDLGCGVMDEFLAEMPNRIFREGISEQHVIGLAAGLALEGRIVYLNTIASFLTRRCLEQTVLDLCLHQAKVRLIGSGGGLVYAPLGPTHLATDDFALMRPLPNMTILSPCDAEEMKRLMPQTLETPGPVYIRLAKGGDLVVSSAERSGPIGRAIPMLGTEGPLNALFVTCGVMTQIALTAAETLRNQGQSVEVLHNHTVKPLDAEALLKYAARSAAVFTVEEHVLTGGLGSAAAEILAEAGWARLPRFQRLALPDAFFCEHGSQNEILAAHGLTAAELVRRVNGA